MIMDSFEPSKTQETVGPGSNPYSLIGKPSPRFIQEGGGGERGRGGGDEKQKDGLEEPKDFNGNPSFLALREIFVKSFCFLCLP